MWNRQYAGRFENNEIIRKAKLVDESVNKNRFSSKTSSKEEAEKDGEGTGLYQETKQDI